MGWATHAIDRLRNGNETTITPHGQSMKGMLHQTMGRIFLIFGLINRIQMALFSVQTQG